jgi:hypothetical protein
MSLASAIAEVSGFGDCSLLLEALDGAEKQTKEASTADAKTPGKCLFAHIICM